jgi:CBS domain-containing protein
MDAPPRIGPYSNPLQAPVGSLAMPVEPITVSSSLTAAASRMTSEGVSALPVTALGIYQGLVTESDLARALSIGLSDDTAVSEVMIQSPPAVAGYQPGSEALRIFAESGARALAVVDAHDAVIGIITPSRLMVQVDQEARPRLVGGLATPFGVYLTTGAIAGGAKSWQLVATGGLMFLMFVLASTVAQALMMGVSPEFLRTNTGQGVLSGLGLLLFLVGLRFSPLAGYHAAEHMVVHAIEQGEPLREETVKRMPRVHPRCGTNLAVTVGLFLGIMNAPWLMLEVRLLIAIIVALFFGRPLGSIVQSVFTTRTPNSAQLQAGIAAGRELLTRYQTGGHVAAGPVQRLVRSGLFHLMFGSFVTAGAIALLYEVLRIPGLWRVL